MERKEQWQVNPSAGIRMGIGYNSPKWFLGVTNLQEVTTIRGIDKMGDGNINGGSVRLNYVKRFEMNSWCKTFLSELTL